jgi:putative endonuclease
MVNNYVYILECCDGSFYTGRTKDVRKRFEQHKNGVGAKYTRSHKPVKILHVEKYDSISRAAKREMEIKRMSKKSKIDLVNSEVVIYED